MWLCGVGSSAAPCPAPGQLLGLAVGVLLGKSPTSLSQQLLEQRQITELSKLEETGRAPCLGWKHHSSPYHTFAYVKPDASK